MYTRGIMQSEEFVEKYDKNDDGRYYFRCRRLILWAMRDVSRSQSLPLPVTQNSGPTNETQQQIGRLAYFHLEEYLCTKANK